MKPLSYHQARQKLLGLLSTEQLRTIAQRPYADRQTAMQTCLRWWPQFEITTQVLALLNRANEGRASAVAQELTAAAPCARVDSQPEPGP